MVGVVTYEAYFKEVLEKVLTTSCSSFIKKVTAAIQKSHPPRTVPVRADPSLQKVSDAAKASKGEGVQVQSSSAAKGELQTVEKEKPAVQVETVEKPVQSTALPVVVFAGEAEATRAMVPTSATSSSTGPAGAGPQRISRADKGKSKVIAEPEPVLTATGASEVPELEAATALQMTVAPTDEDIQKQAYMLWEVKKNKFYRRLQLTWSPANRNEFQCLHRKAKALALAEVLSDSAKEENSTRTIKVIEKHLRMVAVKTLSAKGKAQYEAMRKKVEGRTPTELRAIRDANESAKFVEELLPVGTQSATWLVAKTKFVKLFYHWKACKTEYEMTAFIAFMEKQFPQLWEFILEQSVGFLLKPPVMECFPLPRDETTGIVDRKRIEFEIVECSKLHMIYKPNLEQLHDMRVKVYSAYGVLPPRTSQLAIQ